MQVFEFTRELRIFNYIDDKKYDLFYVERESCEQLRAFFRDADHNHGVTYLPQIVTYIYFNTEVQTSKAE